MELGGALAEQAGRLQVGADGLPRERRRLVLGEVQERERGRRLLWSAARGQRSLEILAQRIHRVLPGVRGVWDEPVQQRDRHGATAAALVFERSGYGRGVGEAALGEEAPHLQVGVGPRL